MEEAHPLLQSIVDWIWHEAAQRVANESHGEMTVVITWRDGRFTHGDVGGKNTIKPRKPGKLPGTGLDHSPPQR